MTERIPIRLCVFSTMRTQDLSNVPGVVLKEMVDFGESLEHVTLLHFHREYKVIKLTHNVSVFTIPYIKPITSLRFATSIFVSYFISIPVLMRIALQYKINLFRADDPLMTGLPCILVSKILNIRCVVSMYGNIEEVIAYKIGKQKKIISILLPLVRKVIKYVVSRSAACIVVSTALEVIAKGFGARKVWLTYPNVDLSIFSGRKTTSVNRTFTVLFVGRLEPEKGPFNFLEVASILNNLEFIVAGYGSLQDEMSRIIKEKKLANVKLLGSVNHSDLPKLYDSVDVLLLPSYSEGIPIVMLEAMASELPVIVSKVGAVSEILEDGNGGFAVTPGNTDEIVSKIKLLLEDKDLAKNVGKRGRSNVISKFNNFIPTQLRLYCSIMSQING